MGTKQGIGIASRLLLAGVLAGASLQMAGCLPLAATGIVVGGMAAVDRRTIGAQTEDQSIELKASQRLHEELKGTGGISVTSYNRRVLLSGQVVDEALKRRAGEIVSRIDNVRATHNELAVTGRVSISTSASDTALTARIKASLIDAKDLQSSAFKIVTEAGVAYLMGIVTQAEGDRGAQIASRVSGVARVVTLYEYVTPDELARIERVSQQQQR